MNRPARPGLAPGRIDPVMAPVLRLALVLICLAAGALAPAGPVFAHAALISASPADGSVLASAPEQITLSFSEPVSPLVLKLVAPAGDAVTLTRYVLRDSTLVIEAPAGLGQGAHALSWRVVSEDGHPVGGSVVFSIGQPSVGGPAPLRQGDPGVRLVLWLAKFGLYLALVLGVGGSAFRAWVAPLPLAARRVSSALMAGGLLVVPAALAAQGLDALGASLSAAASPGIWRVAAATSFASSLAIAALALALGLASLRLADRPGRIVATLALIAVGLSLAASGHAGAASPQWLMRPALFLHGVGVAAWAGALVPLLVTLRRSDASAGLALARFSRRIPLFLLALIASGVVLAVVQVERPAALPASDYGRVLLLKAAWLLALFALAAVNRLRLTAAVQGGAPAAVAKLRRSIAAEIALVLLILATVALWRFTPPPRALAIAASRPASVHIHAEKAMADVTVTPGRAGSVSVAISLLTGEFGAFSAREVRLVAANRAAGIEPIERRAARGGDGVWRVEGLTIPVAGRWTVELEILVSDFELIRLSDTLEIGP